MNIKNLLYFVMITWLLASTSIIPIYSSPHISETDVEFFWGYKYQGMTTIPALDLSSYATEILRKAIGSDYSMYVYIGAGLTYDFSFGLYSPYQVSIYLFDTSPRVKQSYAGHISLTPKNIYFDFSTSSKLSLKIGAKVFWKGVLIAGGEYPFDKTFIFSGRIDTKYESPLGTYQVSVGQPIKDAMEKTIGKIVPKIELILGVGAGAVVTIPIDWDLELIFKSYIDVIPNTGTRLSIVPEIMTFSKPGALPFTIIPKLGGQDSVRWSFSQRMSMGINFYLKGKITADVAIGIAASYESPWYSAKVPLSELVTLPTKTLSDVLSTQLSIPLPRLTTKLTSIDSKVKDTTLKIFVSDETGTSVSGAKVDVSTRQKSYSARDIGNGYYSVTIPASELSSLQVSASKSEFEGVSEKIEIGTSYLQEYTSLLTHYNSLQADYNTLKTTNDKLRADYNPLQTSYNYIKEDYDRTKIEFDVIQKEYDSLKSEYAILKAKYDDLMTKAKVLPAIPQELVYLLIITTMVFIFTTIYFARRKPKAKPAPPIKLPLRFLPVSERPKPPLIGPIIHPNGSISTKVTLRTLFNRFLGGFSHLAS
jgi:hypothetical protein